MGRKSEKMDIHQLQIFVNVAECKGFLAASKKMHLSQSTVSTHVSALEHELGKRLIRRTARNFELTEDGVKLYKYAVDILLLHRKAIMEVGGNGSEFLRIGTSSVPAKWFVPQIMSGFLKKNPNTQAEMTNADSLDIIRRVKEGSLDIGFVGTKVEKQCKYIPLVKDYLVLAAPNTKQYQKIFFGENTLKKSNLEKGNSEKENLEEKNSGKSDLKVILKSPFLARRQYSGTMKEALDSLKYFGIEEEDLNIVATFDSAEMLRDCVEEGMGISILSYQMIKEQHEQGKILIYRLPEKEFCRELYLIYKNESFLPEIIKKFIHFTEKYFKEKKCIEF